MLQFLFILIVFFTIQLLYLNESCCRCYDYYKLFLFFSCLCRKRLGIADKCWMKPTSGCRFWSGLAGARDPAAEQENCNWKFCCNKFRMENQTLSEQHLIFYAVHCHFNPKGDVMVYSLVILFSLYFRLRLIKISTYHNGGESDLIHRLSRF